MSTWDAYPADYRDEEIGKLLRWTDSGECAALIGLSGSGKSNLLGFMLHRVAGVAGRLPVWLVDCNRLGQARGTAFFDLLLRSLHPENGPGEYALDQAMSRLEEAVAGKLAREKSVCILLDRFDALYGWPDFEMLANNLRALRDLFKYQLSLVVAARKPVSERTELAELFFGHTLWLGPLKRTDALWSARRDQERFSRSGELRWDARTLERMVDLSWGYPALLRAVCEAYADGAALELETLKQHPAVLRRASEFWADHPEPEALRQSGLDGQPLLSAARGRTEEAPVFDTSQLTAKENLLLSHLMQREGQVCEKDDLIRAVWPEDVIYEQGVRDESLAQLVRRLRVKIEPDPSEPRLIQTVPGRGYLYRKF